MRRVGMGVKQEGMDLAAENARLKKENADLAAENARLKKENADLAAENARLMKALKKADRKGKADTGDQDAADAETGAAESQKSSEADVSAGK